MVSIREILEDLPLQLPVIGFNGGFISDIKTGKHQLIQRIEKGLVENLVAVIQDYGLLPFVSSFDGERDRLYFTGSLNGGMEWYLEERRSNRDPRLSQVDRLDSVLDQDVICLTVIGRQGELNEIEKTVKERYPLQVETHCYENQYSPGWFWLTLHDHRSTKDQAIRILQERHGLQDRKLTVFGDHLNDIKMFRSAHRSIAVENAVPELKVHAHQVIGPNHQDSVARFIEKDWKIETAQILAEK